jgi:predicted nuclease of restriction endonuclease-like (RecB) superfamily
VSAELCDLSGAQTPIWPSGFTDTRLANMSRRKRGEEREFNLRLAGRQSWSFRELQRQFARRLFEQTYLAPSNPSTPLAELHTEGAIVFKDSYLVEFLDSARGRNSRRELSGRCRQRSA